MATFKAHLKKKPETMTPTMKEMLAFAVRQGGWIVAGRTVERGHAVDVPASTLRALEARGFLTLKVSPDGNMMGLVTEAGRIEEWATQFGIDKWRI